MKTLLNTLRFTLVATLLGLMAMPAQAGRRSNIFGRSSRSMMGMSDDRTGELITVTPGVKSFRSVLKNIGSIGYGSGGAGFNMRFAGNSPRSVRSLNGSRMSFTPLRGGGMRALVRALNGAKVGKPMTIFPGSGGLAERGTGGAPTSFRFSGFDGFRYTRQQLISDVPLFGEALAQLLDSGLSSVNLLIQRLSEAFLDPENEIPSDPDLISSLLSSAATQTLSEFDGSGVPQEISNATFDLLEYLRSLLSLLPSDVAELLEPFLTRDILKLFAEDATLLTSLLTQLNDPSIDPPDYTPTDPNAVGSIEFTDDKTALLESAGKSFIYLTRNGGSLGEVSATVTLGSSPGTAVQDSDFKFRPQTVKWKDGESGPKAVGFTIINDRTADGDIDFNLDVSIASGSAPLGGYPNATIVIVDDDGSGGVAIAHNTVLVCEYTWPKTKRDLDTGTTFLNETVGYNYATFAPYLLWTGDDTTGGGREVVVVDIDSAVANGEPLSSFNIDCVADWYEPAGGFGEATLSVYFRDKFSTKASPKVATPIFPSPLTEGGSAAHPGGGTNATTPVATVSVNFDADAGIFTFDVSN